LNWCLFLHFKTYYQHHSPEPANGSGQSQLSLSGRLLEGRNSLPYISKSRRDLPAWLQLPDSGEGFLWPSCNQLLGLSWPSHPEYQTWRWSTLSNLWLEHTRLTLPLLYMQTFIEHLLAIGLLTQRSCDTQQKAINAVEIHGRTHYNIWRPPKLHQKNHKKST
jgi:hypothetical protein